ncbi:hypothetical protein Taro_030452 [Colocasia esculenta]|uniref:Uncharacterized protein n=1 Tax=Colocasia esculenta TaxID=4460 RepID=A0A843VLG0_COLES|nr:hypothetical protein [Colocasia esculenta]
MAAPSSSSADPASAPAPPSASPAPPPPRTYISSMSSPILPLPPHFPSQSILGRPPNPPPAPPQGIIYPIVSPAAARGFPPRPSPTAVPRAHAGDHHVVTVANPAGYIRNNCPTAVLTFPAAAVQARPLGFPSDHAVQMYHHQRHQRQQQVPAHQVRPPLLQPQMQQSIRPQFMMRRPIGGGGVSTPPMPDSAPSAAVAAAKAIPAAVVHPKVTSFQAVTSNPEFNNFKDIRDKSREDGVVLASNRKVRLSESPSGSLYALCRSWVRNGLSQEIQPSFGDGIKLLPRPLPLKLAEPEDEETEKEENVDSVDKLSAGDLLQRHVKRAKRVRARLREERLRRIERYKQRLSLLLPLPVEQGRSDAAPGG